MSEPISFNVPILTEKKLDEIIEGVIDDWHGDFDVPVAIRNAILDFLYGKEE